MKKASIFLLTIILILEFSACGVPEAETIEGYWMAGNGETISFNTDGKAIIEGMSHDYSIYDENKLSISFWGFAQEYKFTIKKDVLTLVDLNTNETYTYYKDEDKQAEIQENLSKIAAERTEQEKIQQQLEAEAQAQEDYEKYVTKLKNRIESIDKEILRIQGYITDNEGYIADRNQNIQEEHNSINELEKEIAQLQYSTDETAQGDIEYLRGTQEYHYGNIEYYNGEIEYYNNEITNYKEDIANLETEKNRNH